MRSAVFVLAIAMMACNGEDRSEEKSGKQTIPQPSPSADGSPIAFPQVDDNVRHDTLLIQTTFDLGDGTFMMVASHSDTEQRLDQGDRNAGLRLYHYRIAKDSLPEILAASSTAHDSWTMFPTFFRDPAGNAHIILANFGARDSWGQKVIRFDRNGFQDLGFLKVAKVERTEEEIRQRNIAPHSSMIAEQSGWTIQFDVEELMLFDDLRGGTDVILPGGKVNYRWDADRGLVLVVDGEERHEEAS